MYFRIYRLPKKWLDKCIKTPVSEEASTNNMVNRPKHTCILGDSTFTIFIDTLKVIGLEKVSFGSMQNLKTVS